MVYTPDKAAPAPLDDAGQPRGRGLLVFDGKRSVLTGERTTIGRSRQCDVVIDDANVSREHAEVRRTIDGWTVVDLGSTNGIKVNGRRVREAVLSPGDKISLGLIELGFDEE
jgi:pSer/pThr/pTyr-binding forkhead associated (FHA) protein